jgi:hypothetical protein
MHGKNEKKLFWNRLCKNKKEENKTKDALTAESPTK